ncbi:MAG TPA: hypothetical protein VGD62_07795 [Acidobacteriaceae bacterium]
MVKAVFTCMVALVCGATSLLAADQPGSAVRFKINSPTGVPGVTLPAGTYSIHVVDHLADRYVVRVEGPNGGTRATFLGIPNSGLKKDAGSGMATWGTEVEGTRYVRGWSLPGVATSLEFAYPKADAVAIAKANQSRVPAIDPESEGHAAGKGLTADEMQMVTLWLLTPTHVGPGDPGIKAERYQQVASNAHKPAIARLPHTASEAPWVWLAGILALLGASLARASRLVAARAR